MDSKMEPKKSEVLEFPANIINIIRKNHNLDKPGRMEESVDILVDWLQKQTHFLKKDFDRYYLETCLITCKGSIERTKERIDKLCTLKTLLPEYFDAFNPKKDFANRHEVVCSGILPKMDPIHYNRILIVKVLPGKYTTAEFKCFFKEVVVLAEYLRMHDYTEGFILIFDYTTINIMDLLSAVNLVEVRDILTLLMKGYGMRVKNIHAILPNNANGTLINLLWGIVKQILSEKLASRTFIHKSLNSLHEHLNKDILPTEYGGKEKPLADIYEKWINEISSPEHLEFMAEINKAKIDEKFRASAKFNEEYLGLPGSFRQMSVD